MDKLKDKTDKELEMMLRNIKAEIERRKPEYICFCNGMKHYHSKST